MATIKRLLLLVSFVPSAALADDFVEWVGANSGVNWSRAVIQAEGAGVGPENRPANISKLMACRAAVVDAQRNLLESIEGVRVEGETVVANMMVQSDVIKSSVDGVLRGAKVIERMPAPDGSCLVVMTAPLGGDFASTVYDQVFSGPEDAVGVVKRQLLHVAGATLDWLIPLAGAVDSPQVPEWRAAFDRLSARLDTLEDLITTHPAVIETQDTGPTGLVLDARGSNFIPSMSPKIRQIREAVIYPTPRHQSDLRERGQLVSLFTRDLTTAKRHPKVGERPVVMKALRTFGKTRTEIVLGTETSTKLLALINEGFLDNAGVIIVL